MRNIIIILVICFYISLSSVGHAEVDKVELKQSVKSNSVGLSWQFEYDDTGRIIKSVDPAGRQTKIHHEFDNNKQIREVMKELPDSSKVTYKFDDFGRRISMTDTYGTVRYKYDGFSRLTEVRRDGQQGISYTYDTMDRLKSVSLGKGLTMSYSYDFLGRLVKINTPAGGISYEYLTGQGMVIRTLPNGIRTDWKYRSEGNLGEISHVRKNNKVITQFKYDFRPDGLISNMIHWDPRWGSKRIGFEYDKAQRLISVKDTRRGEAKSTYDKLGNRTALIVNGQKKDISTYNWAGQLVKFNGQDCTHDTAGNLTSYTSRDSKCRFEYNALGQVKTATLNDISATYQYDGDGYLIARMAGEQKSLYVPDPLTDNWCPLLAVDGEGKKTFYVWAGGSPLAAITGKEAQFFLHDHLGSIRCIADKRGTITKRLEYSVLGVPQQNSSEKTLVPGFAGLFFDGQISIYLTRARAYDPQTGRFLQTDPQKRVPFGSQKDLTLYAYCGGDPVNFVDRSGLYPQWVWGPENMLWQATHNLLDTTYAKQWYASKSESAISSAGGHGIGAGLTASMWDVIGGYIPGEAANQGQKFAQVAWSLALPGAVGIARTIGSLGINTAEGNAEGVFWDIMALGGTALQASAKNMMSGTHVLPGGQLEFDFVNPDIVKTSTLVQRAGEFISTFSNIDSVKTVWEPFLNEIGGGGGSSPMSPTNVGGVYLLGAGDSLKDLGMLSGIAIDEKNGRLVLLAEEGRKIELPPLRMDDVVTIFRSVYEHGKAPFVSIDPDPKKPKGPLMLTRHGKATQNTYVGWVLFEADRVMKAYSLGTDNVSRKKIESKIEGYQSLLDAGFSDSNKSDSEPIWERFWIVPASVNQRESTEGKLILLDIPLKVMTQRMVIKNGKLVPAPDDTPSPQAKAFAKWFTKNYEQLSEEALSIPPEKVGVKVPVPFFQELRRVALITAIAERLRDRGVPMPHWMRNIKVKECPLDPTTPAITVEATKTEDTYETKNGRTERITMTQTNSIYGGVNLAPDKKDIHIVKADRKEEILADEVQKKVTSVPVLSPVTISSGNKRYNAVALPGNDTVDVGANRLVETDLLVPILRDREISLVRKYNSFFSPESVFGGSWTLDLPRLEERLQPSKRTGDKITYSIAYQLTSPLNTYSGYFRRHQFVPVVNSKLLVPEKAGLFHGIADVENKKIGFATKVLLFRDGRDWHFDDSGNLVAQVDGPSTVIYRRTNAHSVARIEGWYGKNLLADVRIDYDKQGRLISAQGSNGNAVKYTYNKAGTLISVEGPNSIIGYQYKDELVRTITQNGQTTQEFEYDERGRLLREKRIGGTEIVYKVTSELEGVKVSTSRANKAATAETALYDTAFRPVSRIFEDGTRIQWQYDDAGSAESTVTIPRGERYIFKRSADGQKTTCQLPTGGTYSAEYDIAGRLGTFRHSGQMSLHQQWCSDGKLASATYETVVVHPEYREDGVRTGVFVTGPEKGPKFSRWLRIEYDELGRPERITDYSGSEVTVDYDQAGQVSAVISKRGGVRIIRDKQGRVEKAQTSWGYNQYNKYDAKTSELKKVELTNGHNKAVIEFDKGKPIKVRQYDGSEFNLSYYGKGISRDQVKEINAPNNLKLAYEYDSNNQLVAVNCGSAYRFEYTYDTQANLTKLAQVPIKR